MEIERSVFSVAAWFLILFASANHTLAHDPGLSALALRMNGSGLMATLTLARTDAEHLVPLDADRDGSVTQVEFEAARPTLERAVAAALALSCDGQAISKGKITSMLDDSDVVHLRFSFRPLPGHRLKVHSTVLAGLPRGHRQYASLLGADDRLLDDKMLDASTAVFEFRPPAVADAAQPPPSFGEFLLLGIEHIATGYDHLVFLLGLLIVGGNFRASVKIITAFTAAHSITLALAALDFIRLPSSVVEPLIAASIMYVGIENIVRRDLDTRWRLAFVFGLIHGCGFASVLRQLGIGSSGIGVFAPLLAFNVGVELGQVALAAVVLPLVWKLKQRESYQPRYVPACSALVTLAGAYWFAERLLPMVRH